MIDLQRAKDWVRGRVRRDRFEHSVRVAATARDLATRWSVDPERAALAGFLHDGARDVPVGRLLEMAAEFGIEPSPVERVAPVMLHAPIGAELVRRELGLADTELLDAIRFHTTGRAAMTPLDMVLFLADYTEPGRKFPGVEGVRTLMESDFDGAVRRALDQTITYLIQRGWLIHPAMVEARNDLYRKVLRQKE